MLLNVFESRKVELKGDGKDGNWFRPLKLYILPKLGCIPVLEIIQTGRRTVMVLFQGNATGHYHPDEEGI
ncbi:hypothetical protein BHOIPH791_01790 [Bartonella henselae]|nr:hypothetical protein AL470_001390 [Bartonella henselae str. Houston-1]UAK84423.1 hypothetical protein K8O99_01285 [Bartonella henselae]UJM34838.1 hypothetical protein KAE75_02810 [Bartonella henselae]UJM36340.1 hypothetical protein KAE77_03140 [Bartonella henselae]UJM37802.1 hypothetical protein KAE71_02925 [Bartonella henselae]